MKWNREMAKGKKESWNRKVTSRIEIQEFTSVSVIEIEAIASSRKSKDRVSI